MGNMGKREKRALAEDLFLINKAFRSGLDGKEDLREEEYVFFLEEDDTMIWHRS